MGEVHEKPRGAKEQKEETREERKGARAARFSWLEKSYKLGAQTDVPPFEILLQGVRPQAVR